MEDAFSFFVEEDEVTIPVGGATLHAFQRIPSGATGLVVFAHGSGSSRYSPRDQFVAGILHEAGLGVFLMDLLTPEEETIDNQTRELRFDIPFLAGRLNEVAEWLRQTKYAGALNIGYFGASTGASAALVAAAANSDEIAAVVSRGGRPDLAGAALGQVKAPTLLVVGGNDFQVIELNEAAYAQLRCPKRLAIVPGATHLFEEPGTLEEAANLAREWFSEHLGSSAQESDSF